MKLSNAFHLSEVYTVITVNEDFQSAGNMKFWETRSSTTVRHNGLLTIVSLHYIMPMENRSVKLNEQYPIIWIRAPNHE